MNKRITKAEKITLIALSIVLLSIAMIMFAIAMHILFI